MSGRCPIIGITGGIGAGKSLVARQFESLGAARFDADAAAGQMLDDPPIKQHIRRRWPEVATEGDRVDRKALASIVFNDPAALGYLESLIHPPVERQCLQWIEQVRREGIASAIVLDVPLLFEAGWDRHCDRVVFVDADRSIRLARLRKNRRWDEKDLLVREKTQWPLDKKRRLAHDIVDNSASESECLAQVRDVFSRIHSTD